MLRATIGLVIVFAMLVAGAIGIGAQATLPPLLLTYTANTDTPNTRILVDVLDNLTVRKNVSFPIASVMQAERQSQDVLITLLESVEGDLSGIQSGDWRIQDVQRSPASERFVFLATMDGASGLFSYATADHSLTQLTHYIPLNMHFDLSPDGEWVVIAQRPNYPPHNLYIVPSDGRLSPRRLDVEFHRGIRFNGWTRLD